MLPLFDSLTVVVSRGPSAATDGGMQTKLAALANERVVRKRRRVCVAGIEASLFFRSPLQLAFELVQEAPVGAVGDQLVRARLDQTRFVQPQGIESYGVFGVILPPSLIRDTAQPLEGVIGDK
jgi:hypothetical protein